MPEKKVVEIVNPYEKKVRQRYRLATAYKLWDWVSLLSWPVLFATFTTYGILSYPLSVSGIILFAFITIIVNFFTALGIGKLAFSRCEKTLQALRNEKNLLKIPEELVRLMQHEIREIENGEGSPCEPGVDSSYDACLRLLADNPLVIWPLLSAYMPLLDDPLTKEADKPHVVSAVRRALHSIAYDYCASRGNEAEVHHQSLLILCEVDEDAVEDKPDEV